ncbi:MAG: DUF2865 domain-containing protein [Hyphomicrobiaceae bacterium]
MRLDREARAASRELRELEAQRDALTGPGDRTQQDSIIRALADNNCGGVYQREARRRDPFTSFWQDLDGSRDNFRGNSFAGLPFATYRTLCVRLCDGYYFPVSFSTLPTHFARDSDVCQSKCAAPAELFFHQNPGGSVDQMVSHPGRQRYVDLDTAFQYRKKYVSGCSCKVAEYKPETLTKEQQLAEENQSSQPPRTNKQREAFSPVR